jgi:hypothetical protein
MYLGNVTELFLTGNAISSTRGLDRIFSLERLTLDENKISQLTHIVGLANLPFLMNLDLKGNPFEIDGTSQLLMTHSAACFEADSSLSLPSQILHPPVLRYLICSARLDAVIYRKMQPSGICNVYYLFLTKNLLLKKS